jgi:hypothetical protein
VTPDRGLILVRELDVRLGLEKLIEEQLSNSRQGFNKQFKLAVPLRQLVDSRLVFGEPLKETVSFLHPPTRITQTFLIGLDRPASPIYNNEHHSFAITNNIRF